MAVRIGLQMPGRVALVDGAVQLPYDAVYRYPDGREFETRA